MKKKTPSQSLTIMTNIVLPNETNSLNNMFGGDLLANMDRASSISAARHSESLVVTAAVNHVSFDNPIPVGEVVTLEAKVSRAFTSSMEVFVDVWIDDPVTKERTKSNEAIYTFVAVDKNEKPIKGIPEIVPETMLEQERFEAALRRRQLSLVLSKRMKPSEATELKKLFEE